jgi:hypothetical protein
LSAKFSAPSSFEQSLRNQQAVLVQALGERLLNRPSLKNCVAARYGVDNVD